MVVWWLLIPAFILGSWIGFFALSLCASRGRDSRCDECQWVNKWNRLLDDAEINVKRRNAVRDWLDGRLKDHEFWRAWIDINVEYVDWRDSIIGEDNSL